MGKRSTVADFAVVTGQYT